MIMQYISIGGGRMKVIVIRKQYFIISIISIIFILALIIFGYISLRESKAMAVTYLPISNKIIVIDPGHGGVDPGAVSKNGIKEDDINLKIALNLKRLIEQSGGVVIMTRETDKGLYTSKSTTLRQMKTEDLHNRKQLIEDSGSQVFISIHLNSFIRPSYYGAQTFYKKGSKDSEYFALIIQKELKNILDKDNNRQPQHRDDVFLLNEVTIPSVLVECGFLSNVKEEQLLIDETYQERIAWSIYIGVMNYFSEIDSKYEY